MADINEDTQPMPLPFDAEELLEELLGVSDEETEEARKKTPEPAMVRGGLLAFINLLAVIIGVEIDASWVEPVMWAYGVVGPVLLAYWIRRHVTPVKKS